MLVLVHRTVQADPSRSDARLRFAHRNEETGRIRFASSTGRRGSMACESDQLLAHLVDVAAESAPVTVETGSLQLAGQIGFPQIDSMTLPFWTPDPRALPAVEGPARLLYRASDVDFNLQTSIRTRMVGAPWHLQVPATLQATRSRLARRHPLEGWLLEYRRGAGQDLVQVTDLSTTGVALLFPPGPMGLRRGQGLMGALLGPDEERIPVRATVRRIEASPGRGVRVGCSFEQIGFQQILRIATVVRTPRDGSPVGG